MGAVRWRLLGMTSDKDIVLTFEEVANAKETITRTGKSVFYRFGRYLGTKLGS